MIRDLTDREFYKLRADLMELHQWADAQLNTDHDRQYIAEHLTDAIDALLSGEPVPPRPF